MIIRKTPTEIEKIRAAGEVVVAALDLVGRVIRPGIRPSALDAIVERCILERGATPSCKGYRGFPASICVSPNGLVVHGIPGRHELRDGDIVTVDLAATLDGWIADAARTFAVGTITESAAALIRATESSLHMGVQHCLAGARLGDVSSAIQQTAEDAGFTVLRALRGHGVGRSLHEDPFVPNFGVRGTGPLLAVGMVLAIEPMLSTGSPEVWTSADGWAVFSCDRSLTAHAEFTVAVTASGPEVLTPW